jgi:hypothetical protein
VREHWLIVQLLARGKTKRLTQRLDELNSRRAMVDRQARAIDDYLNWYEATQPKTMSSAFTELLQPGGNHNDHVTRRRDPISVYLDSIENQME